MPASLYALVVFLDFASVVYLYNTWNVIFAKRLSVTLFRSSKVAILLWKYLQKANGIENTLIMLLNPTLSAKGQ